MIFRLVLRRKPSNVTMLLSLRESVTRAKMTETLGANLTTIPRVSRLDFTTSLGDNVSSIWVSKTNVNFVVVT